MSGNYYLVIVGPGDNPVFEYETGPQFRKTDGGQDDHRHLNQFIVHAALDMVDGLMWSTQHMNLKVVDKFNDWMVSAWLTAGQTKLMLLHDIRNDDGIKNFFGEIHELYIKVLLNPFHAPGKEIKSVDFRAKVKAYAKKYL